MTLMDLPGGKMESGKKEKVENFPIFHFCFPVRKSRLTMGDDGKTASQEGSYSQQNHYYCIKTRVESQV